MRQGGGWHVQRHRHEDNHEVGVSNEVVDHDTTGDEETNGVGASNKVVEHETTPDEDTNDVYARVAVGMDHVTAVGAVGLFASLRAFCLARGFCIGDVLIAFGLVPTNTITSCASNRAFILSLVLQWSTSSAFPGSRCRVMDPAA